MPDKPNRKRARKRKSAIFILIFIFIFAVFFTAKFCIQQKKDNKVTIFIEDDPLISEIFSLIREDLEDSAGIRIKAETFDIDSMAAKYGLIFSNADLIFARGSLVSELHGKKLVKPLSAIKIPEKKQIHWQSSMLDIGSGLPVALPVFGYNYPIVLSQSTLLEEPSMFEENAELDRQEEAQGVYRSFYVVLRSDDHRLIANMMMDFDGFRFYLDTNGKMAIKWTAQDLTRYFTHLAFIAQTQRRIPINCPYDCYWNEWMRGNSRYAVTTETDFKVKQNRDKRDPDSFRIFLFGKKEAQKLIDAAVISKSSYCDNSRDEIANRTMAAFLNKKVQIKILEKRHKIPALDLSGSATDYKEKSIESAILKNGPAFFVPPLLSSESGEKLLKDVYQATRSVLEGKAMPSEAADRLFHSAIK
ncbi:MAG: hypothetical protein HQK54_14295 [Oligoflexales bacterium]|nr:hypothetical protein [Oligoflexales bacterium]